MAQKRTPINHIPVMFSKTAVQSAGGYKTMILAEDYYLWVRMIMNGSVFYNIQKPLANIRIGNGQLSRRRGRNFLVNELKCHHEIHLLGFTSKYRFALNASSIILIRLLPASILSAVYFFIRRYS